MARLIVEAVSRESTTGPDDGFALLLFVSVSRVDSGAPVHGLGPENFRVCSPVGASFEMHVQGGEELDWEPADTEKSGCYTLRVVRRWAHSGELSEWSGADHFCFGLQVRAPDGETGPHVGQTTVRVEHLRNCRESD